MVKEAVITPAVITVSLPPCHGVILHRPFTLSLLPHYRVLLWHFWHNNSDSTGAAATATLRVHKQTVHGLNMVREYGEWEMCIKVRENLVAKLAIF